MRVWDSWTILEVLFFSAAEQQYSPGKGTEIIQIFTLLQSAMHAVLTEEQTLKSRSHAGTYKSNCTSPKGGRYNSVKQALSRRNE